MYRAFRDNILTGCAIICVIGLAMFLAAASRAQSVQCSTIGNMTFCNPSTFGAPAITCTTISNQTFCR